MTTEIFINKSSELAHAMRVESKRKSVQMSSLLATSLPPPRIYRKREDELRSAPEVAPCAADIYYSKPAHSAASPAGDSAAVESVIMVPPATEVTCSKPEDVVEDGRPSSPPVEDVAFVDKSLSTAELGSGEDSDEAYVPQTALPEKLKNMSFVPLFKSKVSVCKNYDKSFLGPPPPQTAVEEHSGGMCVPPTSSLYPPQDDNQEHSNADDPSQGEDLAEAYPNPFKSSCSVLRLSGGLFEEFLKQMDVVMVMFYKGALGQQGSRESWSKEQFVKASERTRRTNHAYAAVDCSKENSICSREDVTSFPLFRLYSKGHTVDTIRNYQSFDSDTMQKFMEYAPVVQQRPRTDNLFPEISRSSAPTRALN